jgi:trans-aconitate methyltransferase
MDLPLTDDGQQLRAVTNAQEATYGYGVDYVAGSPHLLHHRLRSWLVDRMWHLVNASFVRSGRCRVLEVGGGHGTFTAQLAAMGADVTVTEISKPSADVLRTHFRHSTNVRVMHDAGGEEIFALPADFDIVICISVLHHIPDYLRFVRRLTPLVTTGGTLTTYQDPDWYPRRSQLAVATDRGSYFAWRTTQGDLLAGARTRLRRLRGYYDESTAADMTEYHVVRQGVDEQALVEFLTTAFARVDLLRYWSTQAAPLQRLGEKLGLRNTFGIEATGRHGEGSKSR